MTAQCLPLWGLVGLALSAIRSWKSRSLTQGIVFYTLLKIAPHKPSKLVKINSNYVISYYDLLFADVCSLSIPACMLGSISVSMQYEQDDPKCSSPVSSEMLQQSSYSKWRLSPQQGAGSPGAFWQSQEQFPLHGRGAFSSPLLRVLRGYLSSWPLLLLLLS